MNEITEFEKNLSYGLSFDVLIGHLSAQLAEYIDEKDLKTFCALWDAWVLDLPNDALDLDLLTDLQFKYVTREETPSDILPDYIYILKASCVYAVAAQRAHNRKDADAAWALLLKAKDFCHRFGAINEQLQGSKRKYEISIQAATNGGVPGQRVRYMIVVLLHQKQPQAYPMGFPEIGTAINSIHAEIASHVKRNRLKISCDDLAETVKGWLHEYPAFRNELEALFVDCEIKY
ncbi:MAG: hypothetical protein WAW69_03880 [Polaromonas sp.]